MTGVQTCALPILAVSIAAGIGSGLIKVPLGLASVAAEVYDAARGEIGRASCRERV